MAYKVILCFCLRGIPIYKIYIYYMKYNFVGGVTTIGISPETKKRLLKLAAMLQIKTGRKYNYDMVLRYLLSKEEKNWGLLLKACSPIGVPSSELRGVLHGGRSEDNKREELIGRRYT